MFHKWVPPGIAALTLLLGSAGTQAQYSMTYDSTSPLSPSLLTSTGSFSTSGNTYGLTWNVPGTVNVEALGGNQSATFSLPAFTLHADPGYVLGGPINLSIGSFTFTALSGAGWGGGFTGTLKVDNGSDVPVSTLFATTIDLSSAISKAGSLNASTSTPLAPGASTIQFSGGVLTLSVLASSTGQYANILSPGQNQFSVSFTAAPVPEPEGYTMLTAGLFLIGAIVRRRRP